MSRFCFDLLTEDTDVINAFKCGLLYKLAPKSYFSMLAGMTPFSVVTLLNRALHMTAQNRPKH